jgi:2-amino-4-hydroxy-6-hydroxymethyldihydropteridine diphosphokinase
MRGGTTFSSAPADGGNSNSLTAPTTVRHRVYLAVGSNLGDRFQNIRRALQRLCESSHDTGVSSPTIRLVRHSFLHETAPMYVTDQPAFLNGVVLVETELEPRELLREIKQVEVELGRDLDGARNGPRPVDLDILLYETITRGQRDDHDDDASEQQKNQHYWQPCIFEAADLVVPHPRMRERDFVLAPLCEVAGRDMIHPVLNLTIGELVRQLKGESNRGNSEGETMVRVVPLPRGRMLHFNETLVMGILNVTPDSFSDGGQWTTSVDAAVQRALDMERAGAAVIDIGGESTRPGAKEVSVEEELERTLPVIEGIRKGTLSRCISQ